MAASKRLKSSEEPLTSAYDCAMLDLDGVVYVGGHAVPDVPDTLKTARSRGMTLAFVTNNAARTPESVAKHLVELGVPAATEDVVTSAQAAAREVAAKVPAGANVLVVGGEGLVEALKEHGLHAVFSADDDPAAVVQGFHRTVGWPLLAEGAYVLRRGVPWVASNLDLTVPTARGMAPGNGTLVNVLASATGRRPDVVAGKPFRPLFDETVLRVGADRPIVIGDRLDTDIEGAVTCGADSLLVMTGVTDVSALANAAPQQRPDYVGWTMEALLQAQQAPQRDGGRWTLQGWTATVDSGVVSLERRGDDDNDGLRAATAACWEWRDEHPDSPLDVSGLLQVWEHRRPSAK